MAKLVNVYTGGYSKAHLVEVHNFLVQNKLFFVPSRHESGSLMFDIGALSDDSQIYTNLINMLQYLGYWYTVRNA
jgi:hypothetical protein